MTEEKGVAVLISNPGELQARVREGLQGEYDVHLIRYEQGLQRADDVAACATFHAATAVAGKPIDVLVLETTNALNDDLRKSLVRAAIKTAKVLSKGRTPIPVVVVADKAWVEPHLKMFRKEGLYAEGLAKPFAPETLAETIKDMRARMPAGRGGHVASLTASDSAERGI